MRAITLISTISLAVLVLAGVPRPCHAQQQASAPQRAALHEIPDAELGDMRGRYIVGDNRIAWFGVSMVSTWLTDSGQTVQGALRIGFDLSAGRPQLHFEPSVTITEGVPAPVASGTRTIDASGLGNVDGLVQAIQVAGDGNYARNGTTLTVRDGDAATPVPALAGSASASAQSGGASAHAGFDNGAARVLLQVAGQGATEQWIGASSVGQSIRIAGDGQAVSNQLQLDLVRQSLPSGQNIHQNVAQAIAMTRGVGL
ncbi:hypothetical protein LDO26_06950 [Luteimonas sp. BDR2-5]|uniref:hypothetical protein n=1 Tax=Proluteimonas luteida TaxID=2878685 RepID=UPI001E41DF46|nr:hypothetical protein [Luteimonas sp. BDR2-5]MCD9027943.1 hypothetical protein [Luteimonas sp. BDR2-5]